MFGGVNNFIYLCIDNMNNDTLNNWTMKTIEVTMQEIWMATRPIVQRDKTKYTRKDKHKKRY